VAKSTHLPKVVQSRLGRVKINIMNYPDIREHAKEAEKNWGSSYDVLWPILKKMKLKVGAEIGVAFGGHSERMLSKAKVKLYCVDPYRHIEGYIDDMNMSNAKFDRLYKFTKKRLSVFGDKCIMVRKDSIKAVGTIKEILDFVYIDGDHSKDGVQQDIRAWFPKVRDGGIIAGHDYGHANFPGVKQVVDGYFSRFGWEINAHKSGVWWVRKQPLPISYIMPAFNCEETVEESVISIYESNFQKGDELIIVNDASTDSTSRVLKKISTKYQNVKVLNHKYNKGGGAARNTAVENVSNELIFCLDSDNILAKNSVDRLKNHLIREGVEATCFQKLKYFVKKTSNTSHIWDFHHAIYSAKNYLSTNIVPGASGNYLFTKNSWAKAGGYPQDSYLLDTWGFGLRQVMTGSNISTLPNGHYFHRFGHQSYWMRESKTKNISLLATQLLIPFIDQFNKNDVRHILGSKFRKIWFEHLEKHPLRLAKSHLSFYKRIIAIIRKKL
jgi:glycosyltransferase involved in cell wall biosynthesis